MLTLLMTAKNLLAGRLSDDEGQGMVEYTLIVGTISVIIVLAFMVGGVGDAISDLSAAVAGAINEGTSEIAP